MLLELWEWLLTNVKDAETKGHIIEAIFVMENFDFDFGCCPGKIVLRKTGSLPKSVQSSNLSAAEGQDLVTIVIKKLEEDRKNNLSPALTKTPKRFGVPETFYFPLTPKEFLKISILKFMIKP